MDPMSSFQDVIRCNLCETPVSMYCDICHINLCKACVGEHISDESKDHKVVQFRKRGSTPRCPKHFTKICELYCEHCCIPICSLCISSGEHDRHKKEYLLSKLAVTKKLIEDDLKELERNIHPKHQDAALNIQVQKAEVRKNSQKIKIALKKQGDALHKEIDIAIHNMQTELDNMDAYLIAALNEEEDAIKKTITEIEKSIADIKAMSDDIYLSSAYKSRNEEFRSLPAQFQVTLPTFTPKIINRDQIYQQVGSLSKLAITTEEHGGQMKTPGAVSSPSARPLIDEPLVLTDIQTEYGKDNELRSVSCQSDSELWTCGGNNLMKLYDLQGKLLQSVQTKSGVRPSDISVTRSGDLVYTDPNNSSINIRKNTKIEQLIMLTGWTPLNLCSTSSGGLLVTMIRDFNNQAKVVRYSGSTEKQSIQWDDQGKPLYSFNTHTKHVSENKNLDICVADFWAGAVVVVSAAGKLRFRYTGPPFDTKKEFSPYGITTDSQGKILTEDHYKDLIHILDQDGHFLRYIDNCGLQNPWGLCVDSRDNLFVAEYSTGRVKKIQYYK